MTNSPLISIVIPCYNGARFLASTLDSVLAQSESDWECVIVDDGSTDSSVDLAAQYARRDPRFRVLSQANSGPSAARNLGFRDTSLSSSFVTFMDADDIWLSDALETLRAALERCPEALGAHGLGEFIDEAGVPLQPGVWAGTGRQRYGYDGRRLSLLDPSMPTDFSVLINGNTLFPPGLLLTRRWGYEKAGPWDETFRGPEDWDMLIRLSRHGYLQFIDRVILYYRMHGSNGGAAAGIADAAWRVRCKAFHSPENTPEQQRIAIGGWRAYQVDMIKERLRSAREELAHGKILEATNLLARVPVHALRYVRGCPVYRREFPPRRGIFPAKKA